jgi:hypothetical protein
MAVPAFNQFQLFLGMEEWIGHDLPDVPPLAHI